MGLLSVLAIVLGYAVGSIPTAWLVARHVSGAGADVRLLGDGNAELPTWGACLAPAGAS